MRGGARSALGWRVVLVAGLAGGLLLACVIPALSPGTPTPIPTPTPPLVASPTPTLAATPPAGAAAGEVRISEQELNQWLQGTKAPVGEGVDLSDASVRIRSTGITLTGKARVAQLQGAEIPIEIVLRPVVRDERLSLELLNLQLGGAYSSFSGLVKPLISMGLAQGVDANELLAEQGMRVSAVQLQDGYIVITRVPANEGKRN